ncbi:DNA alkylation repair protein [Paucilactobacillus oligofermentans DSM 15707 = LMG 22743]|uniref:DNA alkylation repair protein n=2 Tax=Paucilactobacillus oligofermentans TaxID=293371 RepID=A0A0R1RFF7_9LACO|nr:DNA alkylation repair protein [Paucilactobacillus oligofermentans DSM 15707 = LMG 22743]
MMDKIVLIGDAASKTGMEKYMRNQFPFVGVPKPERVNQTKSYIKQSKIVPVDELIETINELYYRREREYKYLAIDLIQANYQRFTFENMVVIAQYFQEKPWWETVDTLRVPFGKYMLLHPEITAKIFNIFSGNDDFWMRRVAITMQLSFKEKTDTKILTEMILPDRATDEFFIQKAIGWALRDYSKINPDWVRKFIEKNELSKLAVREGSKYL